MTLHDLPTDKWYILIAAFIVGGLSIVGALGIGWWMVRHLGVVVKHDANSTIGLITGADSPAKVWLNRNEK